MTDSINYEELKKELCYQRRHAAAVITEAERRESDEFCEAYKRFINVGKTEREAADEAIRIAEANGYRPFDRTKKYAAGDKLYYFNRGRSVIFTRIGSRPLTDGVRILAAHIDSPRLDLKPNPLYEDSELALFKTHYYGGLRKYQWTAIPLSLHGVICKKDGTTVTVSVGEKEDEPKFYVSDLLPHLGRDQSAKPLSQAITGEDLNLIIGSLPVPDEQISDQVKLNVLCLLHERYGITEEDFLSAELEAVPAMHAADIGFDRSMIGAYGHDDRVCAYTSLMAQMDCPDDGNTLITVLADKEEIGSVGATGLNSEYLRNFLKNLALSTGTDYYEMTGHSCCLSADVNAAYDPSWSGVFEKRNSCLLNRGVVVTKYTGGGGKSGSSDCGAEFFGRIRTLLDQAGVVWQTGELGKVDQGGGGTVSKYLSYLEMDVIDIGVPVISMHAPWEMVAKLDVYMTYRAFRAFCEAQKI